MDPHGSEPDDARVESHPVIATQAELEALVGRLRTQTEIGIDCEFHGEGRYWPQLCLVQIASADEMAAIDPFAVDLAPLGELLADPHILKVLHAALNDIPLLVTATGATVANVFDTQIAASFAGLGATPAYTVLVERLRGVSLSKKSRFTDWTVRPLSQAQVEYALDDVRHLLGVAQALRDRLDADGRTAWVAQATDDLVEKALTPRDRSKLYLRLGPHKGMSPRQLAILREVAEWRDRRAESINKPLGTVAPDDALRQVVFDAPQTAQDVFAMRGLQRVGNSGVEGLLSAVRRGLELPPEECPPVVGGGRRDDRIDAVAQLLTTALRVRAGELGVAQTMIATREQIEQLAAWHFAGGRESDEQVVLLQGWRRAAAGDLLLSFLGGHHGLCVHPDSPDGVVLLPVSQDGVSLERA